MAFDLRALFIASKISIIVVKLRHFLTFNLLLTDVQHCLFSVFENQLQLYAYSVLISLFTMPNLIH